MSTFRYKGFYQDGRETDGQVEASSPRAARDDLRCQGILASDLIEQTYRPPANLLEQLQRRVPVATLALFTRRLATLTRSAVPIHEALDALYCQESGGELRSVLERLRIRLSEGSSLAQGMSAEPDLFSESYVAMVAAGEASGALDTVLERLADFLERQEEIRRTVSSTLAYPVLMAVVGSCVMIFLLTFVVPRITSIFNDTKAALPLLTVLLIKISNLLSSTWWLFLILLGILLLVYHQLSRKEMFLWQRDRLLLALPLAGTLFRTLALARFAQVLGLLLDSGVPLLRALEITAKAVVNRVFRKFLHQAGRSLAEGSSLSVTLESSSLFPPLLTRLIAVGEKNGKLVASLETAGKSFEREFEASIARLISLLEPLLVLAMGLVVGLVVLAVLLPIFQLNQLVR